MLIAMEVLLSPARHLSTLEIVKTGNEQTKNSNLAN
jgi:hypothetical protein